MPENLPTPEKSLKTLDKERKTLEELSKDEKLYVAESLLSENVTINEISEVTGLSIKDIESFNED